MSSANTPRLEEKRVRHIGLQPDLFIASDETEFRFALQCAKSQSKIDIPTANFYPLKQDGFPYKIGTCYDGHEHDFKDFIVDKESNDLKAIFPDLLYYITIPTTNDDGKEDNITIAISTSLWPDGFDKNRLMKIMMSEGFNIYDNLDDKHYDNIESYYSKRASTAISLISPWTIRDYETLCDCLQEGDEGVIQDKSQVSHITFYQGINIYLLIRPWNFYGPAVMGPRQLYCDIDRKLVNFYFPNSVVIHYNDGKRIPVYISELVDAEGIKEAMIGAGLSFEEVKVNDENISAAVLDSLLKPRYGKYASGPGR